MKHISIKFFIILTLTLISGVTIYAEDPYAMSLEENINLPAVPAKKHNSVREAIDHLRSNFEKSGLTVAKQRQGEVLMISIPSSQLFRSNQTDLSPEGCKKLAILETLSNSQDKYKLLIAVHTDNTGDDVFADAITSGRANAIDDYMTENLGLSHMVIIPYGLGRDEPLTNNDSVNNRARNRRVEIFLVPQSPLFSKK